jgi:uncharacterized protein YecE (DUF72 family)
MGGGGRELKRSGSPYEIHAGCAGWSLPRSKADLFPGNGSHLERYSGRFDAVEINSSFYRPHLEKTYSRWAETVPPGFRFSVKMPREITHARRLVGVDDPLRAFISEVSALGEKLGPLLIQLPPRLRFEEDVVQRFFDVLRPIFPGTVVCEPRHPSWFTPRAGEILANFQVARAMADPAPVPEAAYPGGWTGFAYYRLHGSPKMYYSSYDEPFLIRLAGELAESVSRRETWCIFDNTAEYAALDNALALLAVLRDQL